MLPSGNYVSIPQPIKLIKVECMSGGCCSYYKEILLEYKLDENLYGYALREDYDISYRISRKYKLYKTPYARLYHYPSQESRITIRKYNYLNIVNRFYLFRKNIPQLVKNRFCFYWSLIGVFVLGVGESIKKKNPEYVLGMIDGLRDLSPLVQIIRIDKMITTKKIVKIFRQNIL